MPQKKALFKVVVRNGKDAVVRPPSEFADAPTAPNTSFADAITIKNKTTARIFVKIPDGVIDFNNDNHADLGQVLEVAAGTNKVLSVPEDSLKGAFSFQIFCEQTFSFAQGNSDPEFIIEN